MADIRTSQSRSPDPREAVRELHAGLLQKDAAFVVFFCSPAYDRDALAEEINRLFAGVPVVGCTTAGEIGPAGYCEGSLSGASFPIDHFSAVAERIGNLRAFASGDGQKAAQKCLEALASKEDDTFGLLFIDGLSMREEQVARSIQCSLGNMPLVGGSAGDGLSFRATYVFHEGTFHVDSAVLLLVSTDLPFKAFKSEHLQATDKRLVVTKADTATRTVYEVDGMPAAEGYARAIGVATADLNPNVFAKAPLMVRIDGGNYVRAIQKVNPDGSLTFYCAIECGLVLRVAARGDLVEELDRTLTAVAREIGEPSFTFGSDCILRRLEVVQGGLSDRVSEVLCRNNAVGFGTYGEQIAGIHVNQTFIGLAIGKERKHAVL